MLTATIASSDQQSKIYSGTDCGLEFRSHNDPVTLSSIVLDQRYFPDRPDAPKDLTIPAFDAHSTTLEWKKPDNDGGNPIKGYQVIHLHLLGLQSHTAQLLILGSDGCVWSGESDFPWLCQTLLQQNASILSEPQEQL